MKKSELLIRANEMDVTVQKVRGKDNSEFIYDLNIHHLKPIDQNGDLNNDVLWKFQDETDNDFDLQETVYNVYIYKDTPVDKKILQQLVLDYRRNVVIDDTFYTVESIKPKEVFDILKTCVENKKGF